MLNDEQITVKAPSQVIVNTISLELGHFIDIINVRAKTRVEMK